MNEHLKKAQRWIQAPFDMPVNQGVYILTEAMWQLLFHLQAMQKQDEELREMVASLVSDMRHIQNQQIENSSVPIPGPAEKPLGLFTAMRGVDGASLQDVPMSLQKAITDFSKSMPLHTGLNFLARTPTSLTLQLTWPSPMPFTETRVGDPGDAGHE